MQFRRNPILQSPDPDANGGGFEGDDSTSTTVDTPAVTPPAETSTTPPAGPKDMLEAMFGQKPAAPTEAETLEAAATGKTVQQLRDEKGRFATGKTELTQVDPAKPPVKPGDPTQMPDGLAPKAQERFQTLVNTNKDLNAKVAEYEPIVSSALALQDTFKQHNVKREQFEQAMEVVGAMNRGDFEGALRALDEQRALLSMHLGRPVPGADALAAHPDLRAEVDNLQITEARALEIARGRAVEQGRQQNDQRQRQAQQAQQQEDQRAGQQQKAIETGQLAVDKFCKARMADIDYARIEPILLKEIQDGLLQGVPPEQWARIVEKTYGLIQQTANQARGSGASTSVLRPTGGGSLQQAPKTMHEAMWGTAAP